MIIKITSTIFLMLVALTFSSAQSPAANHFLRKSTVYVEALGAGGYGSLNYEYNYFSYKKLRLNFRLGLSTYVLNDFLLRFNPDIIVPFSAGVTYGTTHNAEVGVGQTFSSLNEINLESFEPQRNNRFSSFLLIGYRWQPATGRVMLRLAYIPIFQFNAALRHWCGLSVGYKF